MIEKQFGLWYNNKKRNKRIKMFKLSEVLKNLIQSKITNVPVYAATVNYNTECTYCDGGCHGDCQDTCYRTCISDRGTWR